MCITHFCDGLNSILGLGEVVVGQIEVVDEHSLVIEDFLQAQRGIGGPCNESLEFEEETF